jgi:hypothetical protein
MVSTSRRYQKAVYWPKPVNDGYPVTGPLDASPQILLVRWQDVQQMFIDLEGREKLSNAVIYSDFQLERGGYLLKADNLGVSNIKSYPPVKPYTIENYLEYYKFDGDLTGVSNNLSLNAGVAGFDTGIVDEAVYTDGDSGFTLLSDNDFSFADATELSIAFWLKTDIETINSSGQTSIIFANGFRVDVDNGLQNTIKFSDVTLTKQSLVSFADPAWLNDWSHFAFVWKKSELQDIYLNGMKQDLTLQSGIADSDLVDGALNIITSISAERDIWLDELRIYNGLLDQKAIQLLAGIHPSQYEEAFEIRNTASSPNLRNTREVNKSWLSK